jgi:virulence factor Mce-like protein
MRRAIPLLVVIAAGVVVALIALSGGASSYRVDAIFDTSKGVSSGYLVKVAGVRVGSVSAVHLTPDLKARLTLTVDHKFAPFRADASCQILPEGLITENYVQCDPGSSSRPLGDGPSGAPTVPLVRTSDPVSLQDVLDIFSLPVTDRLQAVIDELGIGLAGRGADMNAILARANPALSSARRVLAILAAQRRQIADATTQTDSVLATLGSNRGAVRSFVDQARALTQTAASHAGPLGAAVADLPPMLASVRRGLRSVHETASAGTPLLQALRAAAPSLTSLVAALPRFAQAGTPAVERLGPVARRGVGAVRAATPQFARLSRFVSGLAPVVRQGALLFNSLTVQGGYESFQKFWYYMAAMSGLYDTVSHMVAVLINVETRCLINLQALGCSQAYAAPGGGTIPVNAPEVGPQRLGTVLPTNAPVVGAAQQSASARAHPAALNALLRWLLK